MKSSKVLAAIATALLLTVCLTAAPLQQAPAAPGQAPPAGRGGPGAGGPGQAPPAGQAPAAQEKMATGQLSKVDASAKEITIKGSDDKEMVFTYNDATQITGVDGPQGLSGKTGSTLRVTYRDNRGSNLATKIEVQGAR